MTQPNPHNILQTGFAFWSSKVLLCAVRLQLFTVLGNTALTGEDLQATLGLHPRGTFDFLDGLVALGFLARDGCGTAADERVSVARARTWLAAVGWRRYGLLGRDEQPRRLPLGRVQTGSTGSWSARSACRTGSPP